MEKVTARGIIEYLQKAVEEKKQLGKDVWLDAALKLTVLSLDESDILIDMEKILGQKKVEMWEVQTGKKNIAEINMKIEATDIYAQVKKQKIFLGVIEEMIRVAKLSARLNEFV